MNSLWLDLPEDICHHIHSLTPLRDAARAACVSSAFLRSWRCYPNLTLTVESFGYIDFTAKVDHILGKHSGVGVKKLDLDFVECYNTNASNHLDSWLQNVVTSQIEELTLRVSSPDSDSDEDRCSLMLKYEFPCSVLSDGSGSSIRYLHLEGCAFRPTVQLGHLGWLARLHLGGVHITGDELECLLSNSLVLEWLEVRDCNEIICLKIPCLLSRLSYLQMYGCNMLRAIENKAQNLRSISLIDLPARLSQGQALQLGESLQLKNIEMCCYNPVYYARAELPLVAPNLETLTMYSLFEAPLTLTEHESIIGASSDLRQMPQHRHHNQQSFKITCFGSTKTLIELTCYILESATSLERVTLDTTTTETFRCSDDNSKKCISMSKRSILEAQKALLAIETYVKIKVPATVELNVIEPCRRCHVIEM